MNDSSCNTPIWFFYFSCVLTKVRNQFCFRLAALHRVWFTVILAKVMELKLYHTRKKGGSFNIRVGSFTVSLQTVDLA